MHVVGCLISKKMNKEGKVALNPFPFLFKLGRKAVYLEETTKRTVKTCTLHIHTHKTNMKIKPLTLELWNKFAKHQATMPPMAIFL